MSHNTTIRVSAGEYGGAVRVHHGPGLLSHLGDAPDLDTHRRRFGQLPGVTVGTLTTVAESIDVRGRGGAGFPFGRKLQTVDATRGRPTVVVNVSEGEPASFKDAALATTKPHLVLDGAALSAEALGAKEIHVVVPSEHPTVVRSLERAVDERRADREPWKWKIHYAAPRFVAGQARAVIELISGRPNLPVTSWKPEAMDGIGGKPTLLSNAETYAQVAFATLRGIDVVQSMGTTNEPGTRLLTLTNHEHGPTVVEVQHGTPWSKVLTEREIFSPVLVGGYHGSWLPEGALRALTVSPTDLGRFGVSLGAGVVLPLKEGDCPLHRTAQLVGYLADQSARRCGPCMNGLPALAEALRNAYVGDPTRHRVAELVEIVKGRGACAHPDGTARLANSLLMNYGEELTRHAAGTCGYVGETAIRRAG